MSTNTSNTTYNMSSDQYPGSSTGLLASQCISWIAVLLAESLAIVVLNIITIIVFVKQRRLQRRSLCLIIHLAVVDLLVGAISAPLLIELMGDECALWEMNYSPFKFELYRLLPMVSLLNLAALSLERMHATLRPLQHRFMKKRVYCVITTVIWLTAIIREIILYFVVFQNSTSTGVYVAFAVYEVPWFICLFIICISYISIFMKIRFGPHPKRSGNSLINRERRLTSVMFIVLAVSLLTMLPWVILEYIILFDPEYFYLNLSVSSYFNLNATTGLLNVANSLVNPIIYAMRMSEFRAGLAAMFRRTPNQVNVAVLSLRRP